MEKRENVSVAIVGSGGAGAITAGHFLLEAAGSVGWQGLLSRTVGPQIRGGEAAALVRLSTQRVECLPDRFDLLIGIDWLNADRFGAEIEVGPQSLVVSDPRGGELPAGIAAAGARVVQIPMKEMAKAILDGRPNMIALGIAGKLLGVGEAFLSTFIEKRLAGKGQAAIEASKTGIRAGFRAAAGIDFDLRLAAPTPTSARRWLA